MLEIDCSDAEVIVRVKDTDIKLLKWNEDYIVTVDKNTVEGFSELSDAMLRFSWLAEHKLTKMEWNIKGLGFYTIHALIDLLRELLDVPHYHEHCEAECA